MTGKQAVAKDARLAEIEEWLLERSKSVADAQLRSIDPDLDLVNSGLVDSLRLAEFAFLLGKLTGQRIDPTELSLDQFRTLKSISEHFLNEH
jgi:acyl carrier protein